MNGSVVIHQGLQIIISYTRRNQLPQKLLFYFLLRFRNHLFMTAEFSAALFQRSAA